MSECDFLIRTSTPDDAAAFAALMADPAVFGNLMQLPYPSESAWRERLAGPKPGSNDLSLVVEQEGQVVAGAGLFSPGLHVRRRHVSVLGISVAVQAQGQGVGKALMQELVNYADRWGQILRIELTVFADNARAIALYEHFGFVREGLHRGYALRDGVYADTLSMARLHPDPPRWKPGAAISP